MTPVPGSPAPAASVIVAAYHSAAFLQSCLDALQHQSFRNFEIILVNSSQDAETAEIASRHKDVIFIQSPHRLLPHAARNEGATHARGKFLVFTDADCQPAPDWISELMATHRAGHHLVCGVIDVLHPSLSGATWQLVKYAPYQLGLPSRPVAVAATGNCSISRTAWQAIGPFDGHIMCGDATISWRATDAGMTPYFHAPAVVFDQDDGFRWKMLAQRFERGREFGRERARHEEWRTARLLTAVFSAPLAVAAVLARTALLCARARRLGRFAATLPLQIPAVSAWCAGEAAACWQLLRSR